MAVITFYEFVLPVSNRRRLVFPLFVECISLSEYKLHFSIYDFFFSSSTRLEAMSEGRVELKCSLYNVHHEIDMDRLTVEWIASKYQPGNRMSSGLCVLISHFCYESTINNFLEKICAKKIVIAIFLNSKIFAIFFYRSKYFM